MKLKKVLFLCTGNSCRSQMAEAIVNAHLSENWQAFSAGTKPSGYVHPFALKVLAEIGIQHEGNSKHIRDLTEYNFDLVITVCDDAAQNCPTWLGKGIRLHRGFDDPANATGADEEIASVFRRVRDEILDTIPATLNDFTAGRLNDEDNPLSNFHLTLNR